MKRAILSTVLWALAAQASTRDVGNIAVIDDSTGIIHSRFSEEAMETPSLDLPQHTFCKEATKDFLASHPDQFDGVITFTTRQFSDMPPEMIWNTMQGRPVKNTVQGIGHPQFDETAAYGSAGTLEQCVYMGSLGKLPASPSDGVNIFFGLPLGVTGVELLGHEYGHRWMMFVLYDKADGNGPKDLLRGYGSDSPNGHYNYNADSHSVMYGNFITDNGNGSFLLQGGDRKYNELDQYLMGLRAPEEVSPLLVVDDGTGHGNEAGAIAKGTTATVQGTRLEVTAHDVARAMGPRLPAAADAPKCLRIAFLLVAPQGTAATAQQIAKVELYRSTFAAWFPWATDNRGTVDTTLAGGLCPGSEPPVDAGVVDAGTPPEEPDAGEPEVEDAGVPGCTQAECLPAPVPEEPDAGPRPAKYDTATGETGKLKAYGCCSGAPGEAGMLGGLTALIGWLRGRRRR